MGSKHLSHGHIVGWFLLFGITASMAMLLLLTAAVIGLTDLTGSFVASALILGGFFALIAIIIYLSAIRDALERLRTRAETVYHVAHLVQTGYEWVAGKVLFFCRLCELLRKQ